jgi:hypothetical protein
MIREFVVRAAHTMLTEEVVARRIWRGPARGAMANVDFRWDMAFYFGLHERELHSHYERLLRSGMHCFDIGTYRGWDVLQMGWLTRGRVTSFETNSEQLEDAQKFLAPSGVDVHFECAFIGDGVEGTASLDGMVAAHGVPDLVKIDIEGAEGAALRSAARLLSERKPHLVIEVHGLGVEAECLELLRQNDYRPHIIDRRRGVFTERRGLGHNRWLVCEGRPAD